MEPLRHISLLKPGASLLAIGVLKLIFGSVFTEEWKAWAPHFSGNMVRGAVRLLPPDHRARWSEQWAADLVDTPGFIGKIVFAAGLYPAGVRMSRQIKVSEAKKAKRENKVAKPLTQPAELQAALNLSIKKHRHRVLVVDNEAVIANTLSIILNQAGFNAKAAFSGEDAIALAGEFQPEMMITDVIMKGMTGIEAAIVMKSLLPECHVWLFGGQAATRDLVKQAADQGHHFDLLDKPTHPADIIRELRNAVVHGSRLVE